jgi:uncharacterized protein YdcH (DUF465 family)
MATEKKPARKRPTLTDQLKAEKARTAELTAKVEELSERLHECDEGYRALNRKARNLKAQLMNKEDELAKARHVSNLIPGVAGFRRFREFWFGW